MKAFGVQGDLVVLPMTDDPGRFRKARTLFVGREGAVPEEIGVERAVVEPRGVRLRLRGVGDRTAAERLVGKLLFVDARHRIRLPRGRYFVHEIIGLAVVDDERGPMGVVCDVIKYPAHDVYVVDRGGRQYMIPAVREFVRAVDLETRTLRVRLIEGMADESGAEEA